MKILSVLFLCMFLNAGLFAEEVPDAAKICMDCHGDNGVSQDPDLPTIAGQPSVFLEETLFAFHDGRRPAVKSEFRRGDLSRPATTMVNIAKDLDYDSITEVAAYFSEQQFVPAKQEFNSELVETGSKIHFDLCEDCHRKGGKDPASNSAHLAGQWTPYLVTAMKILQTGKRDTDKDMKTAIAKLSEQDWLALQAYYASQQD